MSLESSHAGRTILASSAPASIPASSTLAPISEAAPRPSALEALPPSVADYLRRLVAKMNGANETAHAYLVARGVETSIAQACLDAAKMTAWRAELADFQELAGRNGFNGAACVEAAALAYGLGQFASFAHMGGR